MFVNLTPEQEQRAFLNRLLQRSEPYSTKQPLSLLTNLGAVSHSQRAAFFSAGNAELISVLSPCGVRRGRGAPLLRSCRDL